jgi:hypothetical protein
LQSAPVENTFVDNKFVLKNAETEAENAIGKAPGRILTNYQLAK